MNFHSPLVILGVSLGICALVIYLAILGAWKLGLLIFFWALFLIAAFSGHENIILLSSICLISYLEVTAGVRLGNIRGMSFMNLALGTGFVLFMIKNLQSRKKLFQECSLNLPLLLLALYKLGSLGVTYFQGFYSQDLSELLILYKDEIDPFLVFLIVFNLPRSKEEIKTVFHFLLGLFLFVVFLNLLTYFGTVPLPSFLTTNPTARELTTGPYLPGLRLAGQFKDPNLFASFLVLFLPLTMTLGAYTKKIFLKVVLAIVLFFELFVLVLTGSRGGYVGFLGSLVILLFFAWKKKFFRSKHIWLSVGVILIFVLLLGVVFRHSFSSNVLGRFVFLEDYHSDSSIMKRYEFQTTGLAQFFESPLFGRGWRNSIDVHNSYLYDMATLGMIGLLLTLVIYAKIFVTCSRGLVADKFDYDNHVNLSFLAGFFGILVVMLSLGLYFVHHYVFFYAGLVLKYNTLKKTGGMNARF